MTEILNFFPKNILDVLYQYINNSLEDLEEIRIRTSKPIILNFLSREIVTTYIVNSEEILTILQKICDNSIYSYQNQICNRIYYSKRRAQSRNKWRSSNRKWKS